MIEGRTKPKLWHLFWNPIFVENILLKLGIECWHRFVSILLAYFLCINLSQNHTKKIHSKNGDMQERMHIDGMWEGGWGGHQQCRVDRHEFWTPYCKCHLCLGSIIHWHQSRPRIVHRQHSPVDPKIYTSLHLPQTHHIRRIAGKKYCCFKISFSCDFLLPLSKYMI